MTVSVQLYASAHFSNYGIPLYLYSVNTEGHWAIHCLILFGQRKSGSCWIRKIVYIFYTNM